MHAFIYSDGYSVRVRLSDNSTAGFPFLSKSNPWLEAEQWAKYRGATTIEHRNNPNKYLEGLLEFEKKLKAEIKRFNT